MKPEQALASAERSTRTAMARGSLRGKMRRLADRLAATLASVPEDAMRLHLLGEAMAGLDVDAGAMLLDVIWSDIAAGRREFATVFQDLATLDRLEASLGRENVAALHTALAALGYWETRRLLERDATHGVPGSDVGPGGGPPATEPLGARISMARRPAPRVIDRLLADPDHRVIAALLRNPRLTEQEVVKLAASRRSSTRALEAIASDSRWVRRYGVALALVNNPRTPTRIALGLLPRLLRQDLQEAAADGPARPDVRNKARSLLELRPVPEPGEVMLEL